MENTNVNTNNQEKKKDMPINAVFPECIQRKNDRVIMHTEVYNDSLSDDECGVM